MSYIPISIKEAMKKINDRWFLPAIQRPYVWGNRYESEKYICRLFDSIYQKYPIGVLIMWETKSRVAHREFLCNFKQGDIYKNVDEGLWERDKFLVYDGQQRLQTLFSCLKYTFNGRILVFDLSYDYNHDEDSNTGFRFVDANEQLNNFDLKVNTLFSTSEDSDQKTKLRKKYTDLADDETAVRIETNLDRLWDVFVGTSTTSLAYFSIASEEETKVNDIFERLNTGGIPLSKADLLYSKIKAIYPEFEYDIMEFSKNLYNRCHISFESYDILQVLHMIVKGRSRIDENVTSDQINLFKNAWDELQEPLNAFFDDYLVKKFNITHIAVIRNKVPLLVLAIFFYEFYKTGKKYRNLDAQNLKTIDKFFITAEINDWALQSYADNFTRILINNPNKEVFPYNDLENFVRERGNRWIEITENMFMSYRWMALKFMMPNRAFEFDYSMPNRFNPELDHIFPVHLKNMNEDYSLFVDTLWNMQPVKGEVNNMKTNIHPLDFFKDRATDRNGNPITGSKYFTDYDFVPDLNSTDWADYKTFIGNRRKKMIEFMETQYGIKLVTEDKDKTANNDGTAKTGVDSSELAQMQE